MGKKRRPPDIRERFGFAVKARREQLELTQEDLAGKAGIHRTYLSDIERGSRNLSLLNIEKLAANGQIALRYSTPPRNGSVDSIAGVYNEKKNVLGLMPHPERASEEILGNADGFRIFESLKTFLSGGGSR